MFTKEILDRYAKVLIWGLETARRSTGGEYKKGDIVYISCDLDAIKLAEVLYRKLLERGMNVTVRINDTPKMEFDFFDVASEEQLKFLFPWSRIMSKHLNGLIALRAPASLTHLANIDHEKEKISTLARRPLRKIRDTREQKGEFGWTLCMMPTRALAKQAKMSVKEYSEEIIRACYLDKNNPVKIWQNLHKEITAVKTWLNSLKIDYLHIESDNIDLKVTPGKKRQWLGVSGHNIPSFEIFTSPDWRGTEGIYYTNMPSFLKGNYVEGVKLVFKKGEVVKIEAEKGEEFTKKQLAMDKGAKRLGEISLTDKRFSPITKFMADTLFDENIGGKHGNCHIAVGHGFIDMYSGDPKDLSEEAKKDLGLNDSALHWDLINTEKKKVTAYRRGSRVVIYEDGKFKK